MMALPNAAADPHGCNKLKLLGVPQNFSYWMGDLLTHIKD